MSMIHRLRMRRAVATISRPNPTPTEKEQDRRDQAFSLLVEAATGSDPGDERYEQALAVLMAAVESGDRGLKLDAIEAVGEVADPRCADALIGVLDDSDRTVRTRAAAVLRKISDPALVDRLLETLGHAEPADWSRPARGLNTLGWKPSRDETGTRYWIGIGDYRKAEQCGAAAVEPLIAVIRSPGAGLDKGEAAHRLGSIGDARALQPLLDQAAWARGPERAAATRALGSLGDSQAVEPLLARALHGDANAARALAVLHRDRNLDTRAKQLIAKNVSGIRSATDHLVKHRDQHEDGEMADCVYQDNEYHHADRHTDTGRHLI